MDTLLQSHIVVVTHTYFVSSADGTRRVCDEADQVKPYNMFKYCLLIWRSSKPTLFVLGQSFSSVIWLRIYCTYHRGLLTKLRKTWLTIAIINQVKQLSSLKKIQAWTGFEPMSSAITVQCSTNCAIKPTGSWSRWEFVIYPSVVKIQVNIWKILYLNCGERYEVMIDHRSYIHNFKQLWN